MSGQAFVDRLKSQFGDRIVGANFENIDPWIEISPDGLVDVATYLKEEPDLAFDYLNCISGVDYLETDPKKAQKAGFEPHIEVVYHLYSMRHKHSLVLKVFLPRWKDGAVGQLPEVASVAHIWRTADWHEREVYDLCGIWFVDHPSLRRILCPEDWVGHPLRRDYEMPLEYHGIRGR
jgi:NADH-quinone oxidoreductase subunit C